jgi:hypothetical protein
MSTENFNDTIGNPRPPGLNQLRHRVPQNTQRLKPEISSIPKSVYPEINLRLPE